MLSIAVTKYDCFTMVDMVLFRFFCSFVLSWCVVIVIVLRGVGGLFVRVRFTRADCGFGVVSVCGGLVSIVMLMGGICWFFVGLSVIVVCFGFVV